MANRSPTKKMAVAADTGFQGSQGDLEGSAPTQGVLYRKLAYLLVGRRPAFHSVGYQYPAVLIPWFFLAAVEGLERAGRLTGRFGRGRLCRLGLAFMVIGTIGINVPLNPVYL